MSEPVKPSNPEPTPPVGPPMNIDPAWFSDISKESAQPGSPVPPKPTK
jgi:hypothetical protein